MSNAEAGIPRLSVIIAAWNAGPTIEAAVRSALDQRDVDLECVVVDDASTDDTAAVLARLAAEDGRLVVARMATNGGVSEARNRALAMARGTWLTFLDADDRLLPGGLGAMVRAGDAADALVVVGQRISTDGERTWFPRLYDLPDIRRAGRKSLAANPDLIYYAGPVGKLFHRSCAEGLTFAGRMLGDQPWVVRAMVRAGDRIEVIEDLVYEWRRPGPGLDRPTITITSARERSAALGAEAVRMAGIAFDVVGAEFDRVYDAQTAARMRGAYLRRLIRADLAAQLHQAVHRRDTAVVGLFEALSAFLATLPPPDVVAAGDATADELVDGVARHWRDLDGPGRDAFLRLVRRLREVDPRIVGRVRGRSRRWPIRAALDLPVLGRPLATVALDAWHAAAQLYRRARGAGRR
jgi:hypothetical protein